MKKAAALWKGLVLALVLLTPALAHADVESAAVETTVETATEAVQIEALEMETVEVDVFTSTLFWMQGSADLDPVRAELLDSAALSENSCFPPTQPPTSCVCGSCCECNKCWRNGVLVKTPCDF